MGALTREEFDERVSAVFGAQSRAELLDLISWPDDRRTHGSLAASGIGQTARETVQQHLSQGERILWLGSPDPSKHFTPSDLFLVPFSILWGGFAIFWEASVVAGGAPVFFALWGIPFVLIGLYLVVGRFFYKAYRKRRTVYAVTNHRVISIVQSRRGEAVEASYLRAIPSISTNEDSNGRGSVEFGSSSSVGRLANTGFGFFGSGGSATSGVNFYDIKDPRGVADLVERLQDDHA
jgi:hypothetical protein